MIREVYSPFCFLDPLSLFKGFTFIMMFVIVIVLHFVQCVCACILPILTYNYCRCTYKGVPVIYINPDAGPCEARLVLEWRPWRTILNHLLTLEAEWLDCVTLLYTPFLSPLLPQQHNTQVSQSGWWNVLILEQGSVCLFSDSWLQIVYSYYNKYQWYLDGNEWKVAKN